MKQTDSSLVAVVIFSRVRNHNIKFKKKYVGSGAVVFQDTLILFYKQHMIKRLVGLFWILYSRCLFSLLSF